MIDIQDLDNFLANEGVELTEEEMKKLIPHLTSNGEFFVKFCCLPRSYLCYLVYKLLRNDPYLSCVTKNNASQT